MRVAKALALFGFAIMLVTLSYGFLAGDFGGEGGILLRMPWGRVSLIDVYVGFAVFSGWIVYRERPWWHSVLWVALVMVLGNMVVCLYLYLALQQSRGDWQRFFRGSRGAPPA
jgi:hypothetical protein